jgi:hypothetical protein
VVSESAVTVASGGPPAALTVTLEGGDISKVKAATPNWADILLFAEPRDPSGAQRYTVSSASGRAGVYTVTFTSPCGTRTVQVEVK